MPANKVLAANPKSTVPAPIEADFDQVIAKLGAKDRASAEKHLGVIDAEADPAHGVLWRRLVAVMGTLASHSAKLTGQQIAQFYVADGKYRMQVFALEDRRDGVIQVYCKNVLDQAFAAGLFAPRDAADEGPAIYRILPSDDVLSIEMLDGASANPAAFYKDMLGWNRKALRITLPVTASQSQVAAVEALCAWSVPAPTPAS